MKKLIALIALTISELKDLVARSPRQTIDHVAALIAIETRNAGTHVAIEHIKAMTNNRAVCVRMVTVTDVKLASPKTNPDTKDMLIHKVTAALAILPHAEEDNYYSAVMATSDDKDVDFQVGKLNGKHHTDDCFSVLGKDSDPTTKYVWCMYDKASSVFVNGKTGEPMTRKAVAALQTPSESKKTLNTSSKVYNKSNDITHEVPVRTPFITNVISMEEYTG